jgi:hypothetical protein
VFAAQETCVVSRVYSASMRAHELHVATPSITAQPASPHSSDAVHVPVTQLIATEPAQNPSPPHAQHPQGASHVIPHAGGGPQPIVEQSTPASVPVLASAAEPASPEPASVVLASSVAPASKAPASMPASAAWWEEPQPTARMARRESEARVTRMGEG